MPLPLDAQGKVEHHRAKQRRLDAMASWAGVLQPGTKVIPLTRGKFAIVDEADYDVLNQWNWYYVENGYAARWGTPRMSMHRLINGTPKGMHTDHINGNKLDNRRCNLRTCTQGQNCANKRPDRDKKLSVFKGVRKSGSGFRVGICVGGKWRELGTFPTEAEAAQEYNRAALKRSGSFARLNPI